MKEISPTMEQTKATAEKSPPPETPRGLKPFPALRLIEWLRSNLEVFAIAFILAMTIRCFAIEVFKIPTDSMEPTLMGDIINGDRLIANKFIMLFEPIKRFDVILFKFPLDRTKNFIKRVVGLPEEELTTRQGDIYFRKTPEQPFQLARKPLKIQESIWIPWQAEEDDWDISKNVKVLNDGFHLSGTTSPSEIKYIKTITDRYNSRGGNYQVDDIKLAFRFRFNSPQGKLTSQINTTDQSFTLSLSPDHKENHFSGKSHSVALPEITIKSAQEHLLEFMNYDGLVCIKLDRKVIYQYDYTLAQPPLTEPDLAELYPTAITPIVIEARESEVVLRDIRIYRDIYYTLSVGSLSDKSVKIKEGKYFVIGDNATNSKDSRVWRIKRIHLVDGRIIECDVDSFRKYPDRIEIKRNKRENKGGDIWGNDHIIPLDQVIEPIEETDCKFVDYQAIFGKALIVYWPLSRIKLIK